MLTDELQLAQSVTEKPPSGAQEVDSNDHLFRANGRPCCPRKQQEDHNMKQFIFQTPPNILIEAGASSKIADVLKGYKAARRRDLDRWRA
ncbi:hypothetical protein [Rhizobium leguminosarum]|uniref:hypothetical protein n=1 Tax=Rhizobium leguminosarum TaxID=384 RepID=UPI001C97F175|nr:hypothetical protein [Rhizobium leguminosarum]